MASLMAVSSTTHPGREVDCKLTMLGTKQPPTSADGISTESSESLLAPGDNCTTFYNTKQNIIE